MPGSRAQRLSSWLFEHRWELALFVGALVVRLHWVLRVHPPGDYIYSDMLGYVERADRLLDKGLEPHEYSSFFPYGTHWFVAGIKAVFGRKNYPAIAAIYAVLSALGVPMGYAIARRASAFPKWVAPAVGLSAVLYYPQFSMAGYILSETPYMVFLLGAMLYCLRLVDSGRMRDAIGMGVCTAVGMVFRPQILLSAALIGLYWIVRRRAMPRVRLRHLLWSAVPILIVAALSSALLRHNTGRAGLISENSSVNLVFGRCHNKRIDSMPDGKGHGRVYFSPPAYLQLDNREVQRKKEGKPVDISLYPALGLELHYRGYIGDSEKHRELVRACIAKTGWMGQLAYTWTNVVLLWRYNIAWPDSSRPEWRSVTAWWANVSRNLFAVPALLGLVTIVLRRTVKQGLVALNLLGLLGIAAVYFGCIRVRSPYDFFIMFLAIEVYAFGIWLAIRGVRAWLKKRREGSPKSPGSSSSGS